MFLLLVAGCGLFELGADHCAHSLPRGLHPRSRALDGNHAKTILEIGFSLRVDTSGADVNFGVGVLSLDFIHGVAAFSDDGTHESVVEHDDRHSDSGGWR
jgi:hypothetical protein